MISLHIRKTRPLALVAGIIAFSALASQAATAPNVTYTASGTFGTIVSGSDELELAGNPYSISIPINAAATPKKYGPDYAVYSPLTTTGTAYTGLTEEDEPVDSSSTSVQIEIVPTTVNQFKAAIPLKYLDLSIVVTAVVNLPYGTLSTLHPHPFKAPITLTPGMGTISYSGTCAGGTGTCTTVLTLGSGTLNATIPSGSPMEPLVHSSAARVVTYHKDGTTSEHTAAAGPAELGTASDRVTLEFYASGVTGAADVHVQIAGKDATVLYAGPAGHYLGLDQVVVEVPHSLAGKGDADVVMTVDGRTADPLHVQLQ
jgi:hypothetical protein